MLSFYIFIGTFLLIIGCGDTFTCPQFCSCSEMQRKRYNYNHAKCTSMDGLRQLGKTSELHSLDLSSINLEKINNRLDKLTNLSKLDLSDNRLSDLSNLHQRRIRFLNMSGNRITSGKLAKIPTTVKHLNLSNNDITILPENFKQFIHLKSLELADNPLNCSCETLDVRNWLQLRKVWTEKPIRCMSPLQFKGRSWLQIRQSEVCDPTGLDAPRMLPFSDVADDENELIMRDDRTASEIDAIEAVFIPVKYLRTKRNDANPNLKGEYHLDENDEESGSGEMDEQSNSINNLYEGSGDENSATESGLNNDDYVNNDGISNNEAVKLMTKNSSVETNINGNDETVHVATENLILSTESSTNDAEIIPSNIQGDKRTKQESTKLQEPVKESKSTYILLAMLGILLTVLVIYVATKRSQTSIKNRRNGNDIENPLQGMKPMDKNISSKPIQNLVEFIPLIPGKHDPERKPYLFNGEEALLQKLKKAEDIKTETTTVAPTKHLNGNAKSAQNDVQSDKINENVNGHKPFQPISPKPSRYSPVYSHDTGRVKIKLTETTRPKTPILVTRSAESASNQ